ncbi:MAG: 6-carboxytetrahydropterin synthase [Bacteroidales bacterium]|nr:6-carboxytetrahydropterin synthase [Bacteroidales bacterium]
MYYVTKRLEISSSHSLMLSYESKCEAMHGHNWIVLVHCKSKTLNEDGMVTDFTRIKKDISGFLDHRNLNEILPFNPTAENIARWICDHVENCYKVEIWESENNKAIYERDED